MSEAASPSTWSPRPRAALALAGLHLAVSAALLSTILVAPRYTLALARADFAGLLPSDARVGEQFAHTLLLGRAEGPRPRYFVSVGDPATDPLTAHDLGVTHLAISSDRWSGRARASFKATADASWNVCSLFVAGVRVRLIRIAAGPRALSAFERGRASLDAGDPGAAAALFAAALNAAPRSAVVRTHLAFARAVAGDPDGAAAPLSEALAIDPGSIPGRAVAALLDLRRGAAADALSRLEAVARDIRADRNVERIRDQLSAALAAGNQEAVRELSGKPIELLAGDLLR